MGLHILVDLTQRAAARLSSERGQTMAEYGVLITVIAVVVVVAAALLGTNVGRLFSSSSGHI